MAKSTSQIRRMQDPSIGDQPPGVSMPPSAARVVHGCASFDQNLATAVPPSGGLEPTRYAEWQSRIKHAPEVSGKHLARVGVKGSNPFARSRGSNRLPDRLRRRCPPPRAQFLSIAS